MAHAHHTHTPYLQCARQTYNLIHATRFPESVDSVGNEYVALPLRNRRERGRPRGN